MSRSQKIQEFIIQFFVLWFSFSSLRGISHRPDLNRVLGEIAILFVLFALLIHIANSFFSEKIYQPQRQVAMRPLLKYFLIGFFVLFVCFVASFVFSLSGVPRLIILLCPLIFLYPIYFFATKKWYPRSALLMALTLIIYSQMAILKNDRLHHALQMYSAAPDSFRPEFTDLFDKKSLTPTQANDVAWVLTTHPNESLRDYERAIEFARIGLRLEKHPLQSRNIADTLACAFLGQNKKEEALDIIEQYDLNSREILVENGELCSSDSVPSRSPASVRKRRPKYYF